MTNPCESPATCIQQRRKVLSLPEGDPRNWRSPCSNCLEGCARQMDQWVAEPDHEDHPHRITPMPCTSCGVTVQKPKDTIRVLCRACYFSERIANAAIEREKHKCERCGAPRTKYARYCNFCYKASRRQPKVCTVKGCSKNAHRGGLCDRHYRIRHPRQEAHP